MKIILLSVFISISHLLKAEIIIEYEIIPHTVNTLIDKSLLLADGQTMSFNNQKVRIQNIGSAIPSFNLYDPDKDFYYSCLNFMGEKKAFKANRFLFDLETPVDSTYNILGIPCKKVTGWKNNLKIVIFYTEIYGVGFHENAKIEGIPLLWTIDNQYFEKLTYRATNITVRQLENDMFTIADYKILPKKKRVKRKNLLGKKIPEFKLKDLTGKKITFQHDSNKFTVINFWFKACSPCRKEIPYLNQLVNLWEKEEVDFIAMALDKPNEINKLLKQLTFNYEHYVNVQSAAHKLNVQSYPSHFIIDKSGTIVYQSSGYGPTTVYNINETLKKLTLE